MIAQRIRRQYRDDVERILQEPVLIIMKILHGDIQFLFSENILKNVL